MFGIMPYRNNTVSYNPFRAMEEMERSFFKEPFDDFFESSELAAFKTDIKDEGENFLLEADLPGFKKEDIHLSLDGDRLTIHAERHSEYEDKDKKGNFLRMERSYGEYARSFDVTGIDREGIKAKLEEGVLKLTLPKKQETLPEKKELEIE